MTATILTQRQRDALDILAAPGCRFAYVSNVTTTEHGGCVASATAEVLVRLGYAHYLPGIRGGAVAITMEGEAAQKGDAR